MSLWFAGSGFPLRDRYSCSYYVSSVSAFLKEVSVFSCLPLLVINNMHRVWALESMAGPSSQVHQIFSVEGQSCIFGRNIIGYYLGTSCQGTMVFIRAAYSSLKFGQLLTLVAIRFPFIFRFHLEILQKCFISF